VSWMPLMEQVAVRDWVRHEALNATKYDLHSFTGIKLFFLSQCWLTYYNIIIAKVFPAFFNDLFLTIMLFTLNK